jgi:2-phosphosulfolactate phosphatase
MEYKSKLSNSNLSLEEMETPSKIESVYHAKLRLDWGLDGVLRAKERRDICIIVDVLSFSTTVILAGANGYRLFIAANAEEALMLQQAPRNLSMGNASAWDYKEPVAVGRENTFVFPPCYGATCARISQGLIGSTNNAKAVAEAIRGIFKENNQARITFIACGETSLAMPYMPVPHFAVEDFIGVGAIARHLPAYSRTAEVESACLLFESSQHRLADIFGVGTDATYALQIDSLNVVPEFVEGYILGSMGKCVESLKICYPEKNMLP